MSERKYIGDAVYASFDGCGVWLTTEHEEGTHSIYLEPEVFEALCAYWRRCFDGEKDKPR